MSILVCGSLAYDTIMVFPDRFKNHILPEQLQILNLSFVVPEMRKEYGGCSGNIAYNLRLLDLDAQIMATVGSDIEPYLKRLDQLGIRRDCVTTIDNTFTGQAYIITDLDDNQISAFHPGAMAHSHHNQVQQAAEATLGIVSPDGHDGMLEHAEQFKQQNIPFIFDPGQALPMFSARELLHCIQLSQCCTLNHYESQLLCEKTERSIEDIATLVDTLVVTHGSEGSRIYQTGQTIDIPCAPADALKDPTGCGDAYRAGLLYGMQHQLDWRDSGRLAAIMGACKIEHYGPQNHTPGRDELSARYYAAFGEHFRWA